MTFYSFIHKVTGNDKHTDSQVYPIHYFIILHNFLALYSWLHCEKVFILSYSTTIFIKNSMFKNSKWERIGFTKWFMVIKASFLLRLISENRGIFKRKFCIDRIFWRFFWKSVDNIPNICWVFNKTFSAESSGFQLYQN